MSVGAIITPDYCQELASRVINVAQFIFALTVE